MVKKDLSFFMTKKLSMLKTLLANETQNYYYDMHNNNNSEQSENNIILIKKAIELKTNEKGGLNNGKSNSWKNWKKWIFINNK